MQLALPIDVDAVFPFETAEEWWERSCVSTVRVDVSHTVLDALRSCSVEDLIEIPGIGPQIAQSLVTGLRERSQLIDDLLQHVTVVQTVLVRLSKLVIAEDDFGRRAELWGILPVCKLAIYHMGPHMRAIQVDPVSFSWEDYVLDPYALPSTVQSLLDKSLLGKS